MYFLIFFVIAFVLDIIFFSTVKNNQFLFIHDQFFPISFHETFIRSFFIRIPENLSVINAWYLTWYFWDNIYYLLVYALKFTYLVTEQLFFFIILFFSMSVSFIGFSRLAAYFDQNIKKSSIFIISLWYCFNPYTLILWHTGNYDISISLTYTLAPLIVYFLHITMFSRFNLKNIIMFVLLLYFASSAFWLFASLIFFLVFYTLIYLVMNKNLAAQFMRNLFTALLFYIPLASFIAFNILYQLHNSSGDSNATFLATYGSQKGGMLYQMLLYSSWAIYTPWYPRTLFSFAQYYFSPYYLGTTLFMYIIIVVGIIKYLFKRVNLPFHQIIKKIKKFVLNDQDKLLISTVLLYILSVFFAKANQPPFGGIFDYLYTHFFFFTVFRSADARFGFLIILTISLLLLYLSKFYRKLFYLFSISLIMVIQNIYLLNGVAIYGENVKDKFYDRVTYYSKQQQQLSDFLNRSADGGSGYILTIPSVQFGSYNIDKNETFIGQDILAKNITMPFLYLLESKCTNQACAIYEKTNQQLLKVLKSKNLVELNKFPIKYVIHRRDTNCASCLNIADKDLTESFQKVFENNDYSVYAINNFTPIVNAKNTSISFTNINPVRYNVEIRNLKSITDLNFLLSYNKDWKIYLNKSEINCVNGRIMHDVNISECVKPKAFFKGDELNYLWKDQLFESSHQLENGYANKWTIDPEYIKRNFSPSDYTVNKDGSININLAIYFAPQSWLYLTLIVSLSIFVCLITYLMYKNFQKSSKITKDK